MVWINLHALLALASIIGAGPGQNVVNETSYSQHGRGSSSKLKCPFKNRLDVFEPETPAKLSEA